MVAVMYSIQTLTGDDLVWDTASSLRTQVLEASNIAEAMKSAETFSQTSAATAASAVVDLDGSPDMADLLGSSRGSPASAATHIEKFEKATKESAQGAHRRTVLHRAEREAVGQNEEYIVLLPALVNSCAVLAGTKLCREKLTIASAPKAPAPITISSVMRKGKDRVSGVLALLRLGLEDLGVGRASAGTPCALTYGTTSAWHTKCRCWSRVCFSFG